MYGMASPPSTSSFAASHASFAIKQPSALLGAAVLATNDVFRDRGSVAFSYKKNSNWHDFSLSVASKSNFAAPNVFVRGTPTHLTRRKPLSPPGAYNEVYKFKYPKLTNKPEWWWRTLACVPYLIGLQISYTGYLFQPIVQRHFFLGDIIFFVPGAITRLPIWFVMVYSYCLYIGVVKNRDWPHYFRFHVVMGMLLELLLQIFWTASNFFPVIHYDGVLGLYYWAVVGAVYIVLTLMCVASALAGGYASIPMISDAAYIHTLFHLGGFQRPS